jgi:hypothetical protein
MFTVYSVGKPFPGAVPPKEGPLLEMAVDGSLTLLLQFPQPTIAETKALEIGFERYSYYEAAGEVTLASWVFQFPAPVGYLDIPFHVGLYKDDRGRNCLGNEWNSLDTYVLDGRILRQIRMSGLQWEAVDLFKNTIRRQMAEKVSITSYNDAVNRLYRMSQKEIFRRGQVFLHGDRYRAAQANSTVQ